MIKSKLKVRLAERDETALGISKKTGISYKTLSYFKNNKLTRFDSSVLERLCQALNCGVGDILEYIPDTQAQNPQNRPRKASK